MLLHYCEHTGELRVATERAIGRPVGFDTEPLPSDCKLQQALGVGQKVLDELKKHPGRELRDACMVGSRGHHVAVYTQKKQSKGLDWLMSLPVGTRILSPSTRSRLFVVPGGVYWVRAGYCTEWGEVDDWAAIASPENCPTWEPKEQ